MYFYSVPHKVLCKGTFKSQLNLQTILFTLHVYHFLFDQCAVFAVLHSAVLLRFNHKQLGCIY